MSLGGKEDRVCWMWGVLEDKPRVYQNLRFGTSPYWHLMSSSLLAVTMGTHLGLPFVSLPSFTSQPKLICLVFYLCKALMSN